MSASPKGFNSDSALHVTVLDGQPPRYAISGYRRFQPFRIVLWHENDLWNVQITSHWKTYKIELPQEDAECAFGLTEDDDCQSEKFSLKNGELTIPGPEDSHDASWINHMVTIKLTDALTKEVRAILSKKQNR